MSQREINLGFMSMRHATLPERVGAAAAAGFSGISLRADRWQETEAEFDQFEEFFMDDEAPSDDTTPVLRLVG